MIGFLAKLNYNPAMQEMISGSGLTKYFGKFKALSHLDISLKKGQCLGLLGSNGAGKSTTIRIITGQIRPSSGEIRVMGIDPTQQAKDLHAHIGYIPDSPTLYEELSVLANIEVFARLYGLGKQEAVAIMERVQLSEKARQKVSQLSKGLKQRVLIARALVHQPPLIILDEPTTGLDPSSAETIYQILEQLKQNGSTILLTTHLMNDVDRLCDQVLFVHKGEVVESGAPVDLKAKYNARLEDIFIQIVRQSS